MYSLHYMIVSNIAILCCFIPFAMLLSRKMRQVTTFRVLGIYWLLNGLIHFTDIYFFYAYRNNRLDQITEYYNLLDTPLVLVLFACATSGRRRKMLTLTLLFFIAGELALMGWKGYAFTSGFLFVGSGVALVLAFSISGLVHYMKKMEHTSFENSMAYVYASLSFAYGSFLIISIFIQLRGNSEGNGRDSYLLYYISLLLSAAITSMGLWSYGIGRQGEPGLAHSSSSS